ncbi:MAG TPA: hypothetical protein VIJ75_17045, partial [Hanamia sp.]
YWSGVLQAVKNGDPITMPGFTTETDSYYNYHQVNGNDAFITPNNDGMTAYDYGKTVDKYYFTGIVNETTYTFNGDASSNADGDNLTWWDYTKTSLALTGAIIETAVGGLTSETGVGAVVAGDGAIRVAANFSKLVDMIETKSKSKSDLIPTNSGAILGAIIDHGTGNAGQMQSILGGVNDIGSAIFSVQSDYELLNTTDQWLNHWDRPGPAPGIYDDYNSIKEYN